MKLLRQEYGDTLTIMVDANSGYTVNSALKLGRIFEKYDVFWFEEPIPPDNIPGYHELTQKLDIPIASGESEFTKYGIRRSAWDIVTDLIDRRIISNEDAIEKKEYFKELLSSKDYGIRISAWYEVTKLIDSGIISNEDAIEKKEYFKGLLSSRNYVIRLLACGMVMTLIDRGIISNKEVRDKC